LATSADSSEGAGTLPRPDLNPLLNPLLAENMGRWAEVYFTSAPEKREEAVLELLRELQARKSDNLPPESQAASSGPCEMPAGTVDGGQGDQRRCSTCGHDNPSKHQFCGMCGSQLGGTAPEQLSTTQTSDSGGGEKELAEGPAVQEAEADFRELEEPGEAPYDFSLLQSLRAAEPTEDFDYDGSPLVRYRYYIGAFLGIVILVLGYLAWRGAQAGQSAQATPTPPPPAATESAAAASSTVPASAPAPRRHAVEPQPAPAGTNTAEPTAPKSAEIPKPVKATGAAEHTLPSTAAPASNNGHGNSAGSGAEEYARAERYLNSEPRDGAQAAKWLWKAMAKHNGPAALALADLYLKGEGVSKNCDQARVLLDSAARRDMAGAGERLRNLQAFGCQ
jgi:hypothetical protein